MSKLTLPIGNGAKRQHHKTNTPIASTVCVLLLSGEEYVPTQNFELRMLPVKK